MERVIAHASGMQNIVRGDLGIGIPYLGEEMT